MSLSEIFKYLYFLLCRIYSFLRFLLLFSVEYFSYSFTFVFNICVFFRVCSANIHYFLHINTFYFRLLIELQIFIAVCFLVSLGFVYLPTVDGMIILRLIK